MARGANYRCDDCGQWRTADECAGCLFPSLPGGPLAGLILAAKRPDEPIADLCRRLHISDRILRAWRNKPDTRADFNTVDRILQHLELLWWEVYDERTVPDPAVLARVRYAFTGEELEMAA